MRQTFINLYQRIAASPAVSAWQTKFWPAIEKFLIAGPTLVGFIWGLYRFDPKEAGFEVAFQSFVYFVLYMAYLTVIQTLDSLFFDSTPFFVGFTRSLGAAIYIAITLAQYWKWRKGEVLRLKPVARLKARLDTFLQSKGEGAL